MMSAAQQMLQDSRTKIELLRMQIIKVSQAREGERDSVNGNSYHPFACTVYVCSLEWLQCSHCRSLTLVFSIWAL